MSLDQLEKLAERYMIENNDSMELPFPNLHILQREEVSEFECVVYNPVICLILRGSKVTSIGTQRVSVSRGDALLVSHDLPVSSKITKASTDCPYLALVLSLDLGIIRNLYEQVGEEVIEVTDARSLSIGDMESSWVEPLVRYVEMMSRPLEAKVLGPLVLREIHFQLLMSPIGGMLRNLLLIDSHASRISEAISKIRSNFQEPLAVAELARVAGMGQSSFHEHFKSVTGTSPLDLSRNCAAPLTAYYAQKENDNGNETHSRV